jgi:hypothetical protein
MDVKLGLSHEGNPGSRTYSRTGCSENIWVYDEGKEKVN